ncbi:MAG: UvrD-helicase domain-containing protein [Pseudomonadota bacterium]
MAKLLLHRNLLKNFGKMPIAIQKKASGFIDRFQENPFDPSLRLHSLKESMVDPKVRGANLPDGYRAIIIAPEKGDTWLLMHIAPHDEAYDWARNKRFEVHEKTGVFQIFDAQEITTAVERPEIMKPDEPDYPLGHITDEEFYQAGVPRPLIPAVKAVRSDAALEAIADYLPPDCRDVLYGLAAGMSLEEALREMLGLSKETKEIPEGPGDFSRIDRAVNFDLVLIEGQEQLKDILAATLEEWRIFLHPCQRKLVEWETNGPMSISGSAGTGKTVALMHRAVQLAGKIDDRGARVLVTTFTTNLSITIKQLIRRLAPDAAERIEVTNLHALARTICNRSGWRGRIAEDMDLEGIWEDAWLDPSLGELPLPRDEMKNEYRLVVDSNGIDSEEAYLTTVRSGRPRISRQQRKTAWPVFRAIQRSLKKKNLLTFEGAIHQARLAVEQGNFPKYPHVLVDEVQDFSLEALRLIRALSPAGEAVRDPLCLAGDGHQRIYRTPIPMSRAGIEIRGRSRRLKINYRTSEQIRKYAQGILQGLDIDDLDGASASIAGDHSAFKGPEPIIESCRDEKSEADAIVAWVQTLLESHYFGTHEICVTPYKPAIRLALTAANIPTYELKPREEDPGMEEPGVRLGTMKRIKGLEFRAIAMACANLKDPMNALPTAGPLDRCERYVAATRAREQLLITLAA